MWQRHAASASLPSVLCGWGLWLMFWATTECHQLLFSDLSEQRRNFAWPEKLTEQFTFQGNVIFSDKELMLLFLANSLKAYLSVAFLDVISWRKHPWPWLNKTGHLFHGVAVLRNVNKWQLKDDITINKQSQRQPRVALFQKTQGIICGAVSRGVTILLFLESNQKGRKLKVWEMLAWILECLWVVAGGLSVLLSPAAHPSLREVDELSGVIGSRLQSGWKWPWSY